MTLAQHWGDGSSSDNPSYTVFADGPTVDSFGRLRVSQPQTIFDSKQIFDNGPLFWDDQETSGSGTTSTHSADAARTRIGVGNTTAGKRIRQTFQRFNYQPGKSQLVLLTAVLSNAGTGITAEVGYHDDDNGLFFQSKDSIINVVRRSNVTGSPVDETVAQSSWNKDTMDGSGPSGITLDPTKTQIMWIDFEWLGVGRVRMGFVVDGAFIVVHEFNHANSLDVVYMSTPNLPLRYSIENDGTGAAATMDHICSTVINEGGQDDLGVLRHTDNGGVAALSSGTVYALLGLRLKSTHLGATIDLINNSLLATSANDNAHWELRLNPTVASTFTYADITDSAAQVAVGVKANTVTGGTEIDGGYFSTDAPASAAVENALRLGSTISGTPDEIVLCVKPITNNITVHGSITWRELI